MKKIITQNQILQNFFRFKQSCWSLLLLLFFLLSTNNTIGQTFRSYARVNATAASVSVTKPAGLVAGDLMIAQISRYRDNSSSIANAESTGWSVVGGINYAIGTNYREQHTTVLSKIATAADVAATNFTFTGDNTVAMSGAIMAFSGACNISVIGSWDAVNPTQSGQLTAPAITTLTPNAMVVMIGAYYGDRSLSNWSFNNTAMTERYDYNTSYPRYIALAAATLSLSAIATNATGSANFSSAISSTSILLAL